MVKRLAETVLSCVQHFHATGSGLVKNVSLTKIVSLSCLMNENKDHGLSNELVKFIAGLSDMAPSLERRNRPNNY